MATDKRLENLVNNMYQRGVSDESIIDAVKSYQAFREMPDNVLDGFARSDDSSVRMQSAIYGRDKDLDILCRDDDWKIRREVMLHGRDQDLDIGVHDEISSVREEVMKFGRDKDLDIGVHDSNSFVRLEVMKHGRDQDLDIGVHDEMPRVRKEVAKHGRDKDLDILRHDKESEIRKEVMEFGRDKDDGIFANDSDWYIRKEVMKFGRDKDLDIGVHDKNPDVRVEVMKHGRDKDLDIGVHDKNPDVREEVMEHGRDKDLDIGIHDDVRSVRLTVLEHGRDKDLDIAVHDKDWRVREVAAIYGNKKQHDILINDSDEDVRRAVVGHGGIEHVAKGLEDNTFIVWATAQDRLQEFLEKGVISKESVVERDGELVLNLDSINQGELGSKEASVEDAPSFGEQTAVFINGIDPSHCTPHENRDGSIANGRVDVSIPFDLGDANFGEMYNLSEKQVVDDQYRPGKVSLLLDANREYNVYARTSAAAESGHWEKMSMTGAEIKEHAEAGMQRRREFVADNPDVYGGGSTITVPDDGFGTNGSSSGDRSDESNFNF